MNQAALNAFLQELKASIKKLESVLATTPTEESSLWCPEDPENAYGPRIENNGVDYRKLAPGTRGQILYGSKRFAKSRKESEEDYYNISKEESPWYTPEEKLGPWVETYGNPIPDVPQDQRVQLLTRWQRINKCGPMHIMLMQTVREDHEKGLRFFSAFVAYRIVL